MIPDRSAYNQLRRYLQSERHQWERVENDAVDLVDDPYWQQEYDVAKQQREKIERWITYLDEIENGRAQRN